MKKVLIIDAHPWENSLGASFADVYEQGAELAGAELKRINLRELRFDPFLSREQLPPEQFEPCIPESQQAILWADHLVFIYPTWWTNLPALLKGFVDRVFTSGVTFRYHDKSPFPEPLLKGKSARLLITMDAPAFYNRWVTGNPQTHAMRKGTLMFCGVKPVRVNVFDRMRYSDEKKRNGWVTKIIKLAGRDAK
jgi:NAD(P)H dehydrogenase (quinone)